VSQYTQNSLLYYHSFFVVVVVVVVVVGVSIHGPYFICKLMFVTSQNYPIARAGEWLVGYVNAIEQPTGSGNR